VLPSGRDHLRSAVRAYVAGFVERVRRRSIGIGGLGRLEAVGRSHDREVVFFGGETVPVEPGCFGILVEDLAFRERDRRRERSAVGRHLLCRAEKALLHHLAGRGEADVLG